VQRNINELTRSVEEAGQLVGGTKKDIEQRRGEIGDIIVAAREAAASVGVAHFSGPPLHCNDLVRPRLQVSPTPERDQQA